LLDRAGIVFSTSCLVLLLVQQQLHGRRLSLVSHQNWPVMLPLLPLRPSQRSHMLLVVVLLLLVLLLLLLLLPFLRMQSDLM
jgi:hypothetical protein